MGGGGAAGLAMKIRDAKFTTVKGHFTIENGSDAFANAVRCVMSRDVATPAVTSVLIRNNTSIFADDYIAHRIGLVPIRGPASGTMQLRARGPGRVYSRQIEGGEFTVVAADVVLATLTEGAEIDMELRVSTALASSHVRHSAAVAARYTHRTVGVDHPECFCDGTRTQTQWGARCVACGFRKRPEALANAPRCHLFQFETTGSLTAEELYTRTMATLASILRKIVTVLDQDDGTQEDVRTGTPNVVNVSAASEIGRSFCRAD